MTRVAVPAAMIACPNSATVGEAQGGMSRRGISVSWTCAVGARSSTIAVDSERGSDAAPMILVTDKDEVPRTFGRATEIRYRAARAGERETLSFSDRDKRFSIHPASAVDAIIAAMSDGARAIDITGGGKPAGGNCTRRAGALLSAGDTGIIQIGGSK